MVSVGAFDLEAEISMAHALSAHIGPHYWVIALEHHSSICLSQLQACAPAGIRNQLQRLKPCYEYFKGFLTQQHYSDAAKNNAHIYVFDADHRAMTYLRMQIDFPMRGLWRMNPCALSLMEDLCRELNETEYTISELPGHFWLRSLWYDSLSTQDQLDDHLSAIRRILDHRHDIALHNVERTLAAFEYKNQKKHAAHRHGVKSKAHRPQRASARH